MNRKLHFQNESPNNSSGSGFWELNPNEMRIFPVTLEIFSFYKEKRCPKLYDSQQKTLQTSECAFLVRGNTWTGPLNPWVGPQRWRTSPCRACVSYAWLRMLWAGLGRENFEIRWVESGRSPSSDLHRYKIILFFGDSVRIFFFVSV